MGKKTVTISDEAYLTLEGLKGPNEGFSETIIRLASKTRTNLIRRLCVVLWGYCFALWLYVIAYQLRNPSAVYDVLVWWLPFRMDYLAEAAFVLSLIFALTVAYHRN